MIYAAKILFYIESVIVLSCIIFRCCLSKYGKRYIGNIDIIILVSVPAVGFLIPNKIVLFSYISLILLLSLNDRMSLAKRYLLLITTTPLLAMPYTIGGVFVGFWSAISFLNLSLLIAVIISRYKSKGRDLSSEIAVWILLIVSIVVANRGSTFGSTIRDSAGGVLLILPPFYMMTRLIKTADDASQAMLLFAFGGFCNAAIAIFEAARHWPLYEAMSQRLDIPLVGLSATLSMRGGMLRANGAVGNYEVLGLLCAMTFITIVALRRQFSPAGWRLALGIVSLGLVAAQARSAWIALIVGVLVFLIASGKWKSFSKVSFGLGAILSGLYLLSRYSEKLSTMMGLTGHGQDTASYRNLLLTRSWEEFLKHPILGQTAAEIQVSMNDLRQSEHIIDFVNTHLPPALIGGIPLLLAWAAAWCLPIISGWHSRPLSVRSGHQPTVALPIALIVACAANLAFTSAIDRVFVFVALGFGLNGALVATTFQFRTKNANGVNYSKSREENRVIIPAR